MCAQPYRVWDHSRQKKHGLVAKSLKDLITKGKKKFDCDENESVQVVLEVDGTEVSDQDYFSCLPKDTTLMLLRDDQQWAKLDRSDMSSDTIDGPAVQSSRKDRLTAHVIRDVIANPTDILTLSLDQMQGSIDNKPALVQVMAWRRTGVKPLPEPMQIKLTNAYMKHSGEIAAVAADASEVSNELNLNSESVEDAQRWIQSHLDNCENIRESKELLQLLQKAHAAKT